MIRPICLNLSGSTENGRAEKTLAWLGLVNISDFSILPAIKHDIVVLCDIIAQGIFGIMRGKQKYIQQIFWARAPQFDWQVCSVIAP